MQNLEPYYYSKIPNKAALLDLIHNVNGSVVAVGKARLLHEDLTPFHLLAGPNPDDPADISEWLLDGKVENNVSRAVHRQLTCTVDEITAATLNALSDRVEISIAYYLSGSYKSPVLQVPIGTFLMDFPDRTISNARNHLAITGYDLTQTIADIEQLESGYTAPQGTNYVQLAEVLAKMDSNPPPPYGTGRSPSGPWPWPTDPGMTPNQCPIAGPNWPASRILAQASDQVTPTTMKLDPETGLITHIGNVLTAVNFWPAWVDSFRMLRYAPIPYQYPGYAPTGADAEWEYSTITRSILRDGVSVKLADKQNLANRVQVVSYNTGLPRPISVTLQNDSHDSAISVPLLGRVKFVRIRDDNLPNADTARARCVVELNARAIANESVEFVTAWNPFHESHDLLALNIYARDGVVKELDSTVAPFIETQWTIDLKSPTNMQHLVGRLVSV